MKNTYSIKILTVLCLTIVCPLHGLSQLDNGITVRLNHKLLDFSKIDDFSHTSGSLSEYLSEDGQVLLNDPKFATLSAMKFTKIFSNLRTSDSISISRSGDTVYIPPFWATFNVKPNAAGYSKTIDYLKSCYPLVVYAHPNYSGEFLSVPDDTLFFSQQSLSSSTFPNGHINVDSAWNIETGKRCIKVGVFDSGIDTTHPDLKVLTGRGYNLNIDTDSTSWGSDEYGYHGHGTPVAGIIGAKRNNTIGVAGIAGGDGNDTSGVSLIDFRLSPNFDAENISRALIDASRSIGTYYDWSASEPPIVNEEAYWYHANGYGIHLGNHSYHIVVANVDQIDTLGGGKVGGDSTVVTDPGETTPQDCTLCREAFLFSLQNGVVNVCASGNGVFPVTQSSQYYTPDSYIPQNYDDSWVINVGGSGTDGEWFDGTNGMPYETNYFARANTRLDIIAPFTQALINSTASIQAEDTVNRYGRFSGTSGATPHATGVAALLLSKYNQNCYSNSNLDPADVEYILEKSASGTAFSDYSGYGLINAYKALKMIDFPEYQIIHPDLIPTSITETDSDTITLFLNNPIYGASNGPLSSSYPLENERYYRVVRKEVQVSYDFSDYMQPSTQILDYWTRSSQTNSIQYINDTATVNDPDLGMIALADTFKIEPSSEILNFNPSGIIALKGYYYHFIGQYTSPNSFYSSTSSVDYWYPLNPLLQDAKMAFSVYLRDSLALLYFMPCDSLNPLIDSLASIHEWNMEDIVLYPNPGNGNVKIISNGSPLKNVQVTGANGVCIQTKDLIFDPESGVYEFDFSELASGLYNIVLYTRDDKRITKKWLKL